MTKSDKQTNNNKTLIRALLAGVLAVPMLGVGAILAAGSETSRFSDEPLPYLSDDDMPKRTPPILEIGDPFLATGNISPGFTLPTGAVWQPRFWVYGEMRGALQAYDTGPAQGVAEAASRLDLFGNLQLTGTERLLIGVTPLHEGANFTRYTFEPDSNDGGDNHLNLRIRTLFFEGDIAEIFPRWDVLDAQPNDIGFAVGRQGVNFQGGMLINDTIDAFGLTKNNIRFQGVPWLVGLRVTGIYGWNEINRDDNRDDNQAQLFGLFTQWDTVPSTVNIDVAYLDTDNADRGDLLVGGIEAIQRIGKLGTTFRALGSYAPDSLSTTAADNGVLLFSEVNWTPPYTDNIAYVNAFAGFNNFNSIARDTTAGGPLGATGLLFASRGIGTFPAPISNRADDAFGGAVGYQMFFDNYRRQFIVEFGGRRDNSTGGFDAVGFAARLQQAIGRRYIIQLDGFVAAQEDREDAIGARTEFLVRF